MPRKSSSAKATKKSAEKKASPKTTSIEYETDSQKQNRHGNGRLHNGSDGGHQGGRGMNH